MMTNHKYIRLVEDLKIQVFDNPNFADIPQGRPMSTTTEQALKKFDDLFNAVGKVMYDYSICSVGCSNCCHQSVMISSSEAERIAKSLGIDYLLFDRRLDHLEDVEAYQQEFKGKACPFLKDNLCSIYLIRPGSCRSNYNLEGTSDNCDTINYPDAKVVNVDFIPVFMTQICWFPDDTWADIRDFFPVVPVV
jgi:Fe-S-cluster containining protein